MATETLEPMDLVLTDVLDNNERLAEGFTYGAYVGERDVQRDSMRIVFDGKKFQLSLADGVGEEGEGRQASEIAVKNTNIFQSETSPLTLANGLNRLNMDLGKDKRTTLITGIIEGRDVDILSLGDSEAIFLNDDGTNEILSADGSFIGVITRCLQDSHFDGKLQWPFKMSPEYAEVMGLPELAEGSELHGLLTDPQILELRGLAVPGILSGRSKNEAVKQAMSTFIRDHSPRIGSLMENHALLKTLVKSYFPNFRSTVINILGNPDLYFVDNFEHTPTPLLEGTPIFNMVNVKSLRTKKTLSNSGWLLLRSDGLTLSPNELRRVIASGPEDEIGKRLINVQKAQMIENQDNLTFILKRIA